MSTKEKEPKYELIVSDVNFDSLNKSITTLGEAKKLSEKEKEIGVQLISEWERNVIDRLGIKRRELNSLQRFFGVSGNGYWGGDDYDSENYDSKKEQLAEFSGTQAEYEAFKKLKDEYREFQLTAPVAPHDDPTKTVVENDLAYSQYQLAAAKHHIEDKKLVYKMNQAYTAWKSAMKKKPEVKKMLSGVEEFLTRVSKYELECKDKGNLAKINLAISNTKVREAIKEMIDFTKKIK